MMDAVEITLLVENRVNGMGLWAEHGLSFRIETGSRKVLFDTGQSFDVLVHNARRLDMDLGETDTIVLSHGHYDHTGGLEGLLRVCPEARVVFHPDATRERYGRSRGRAIRENGMPRTMAHLLHNGAYSTQETRSPVDLGAGLVATGEIPRRTDYEDTGGNFYLDPDGEQADALLDDQAVFFDTPDGLVILLGCGHAGVINTCIHVQDLTGGRPIHAIVGGFHLLNASDHRLARTVDALRELNVGLLVPLHCTGHEAVQRLWFEFPDLLQPFSVGQRLRFATLPTHVHSPV